MTTSLVEFTLLIRDTRHMDARAATDLADWLERLELEGKASRVVVLMPSAAKAVADLDLLESLQPDQYIWHSQPGGGQRRMRRWPVGDTTFSRHYVKCIEAAGVTYRKPHTTRHTFHELLRLAGLGLEERQAMMGHASIRTTVDVYGHLDFDTVAAKLADFKLEKFA